KLEVNGVPSPDSGITRYYHSATGALDSMVDKFYGPTIYEVNQQGDPVYIYTKPWGGDVPTYIFKQYTYDERGNWIRCITQSVETSDPSEVAALKKKAPYMLTTRQIKY
ncbi:MAG TPA: hypothetical protein VHM26_18305, partial [Chitinophagaceae bacterium]|nr:hypothetical protein [Chitinophagaceae bacterium]